MTLKPEEEKATLNSWIDAHEGDPMYMFGAGYSSDPSSQTECIGDNNIKASEYGIANLKKVVPNLIDWTTTDGENYTELNELYGELVGVWNRYINHVITNVGGVYETLKTADQEGVVYTNVEPEVQSDAMNFLLNHAFQTPDWMMNKEILGRIQDAGIIDRMRSLQVRYLNSLMDMGRMQRLIEAEYFDGPQAYGLMDMCKTLRNGLWIEINGGQTIDLGRRNLQRAYLERMEYLLTEEQPSSRFFRGTRVDVSQSDIRAVVRAELKTLHSDLEKAVKKTSDNMTKIHLEDCVSRIEAILE